MKKNIILNLMLYLIVSSTYAQIQKGQALNGEDTLALFGCAVSMPNRNIIGIGSYGYDTDGQVKIYRWNGYDWEQKGPSILGDSLHDNFGYSVSMPNSNIIAVGSWSSDFNGANAGSVNIYRWVNNNWSQKGSRIDGEASGDRFGYSISMPDANTIAIGAPRNDGNGTNSGHVRIYRWNGTDWIQKGNDIDGEASSDFSGVSVSMPDSNTVAIGATYNDGNGSDAGQVRIYHWNGSAWVQKGNDIDGEAAYDYFGKSISMPNSNIIAIGASRNDGNGNDAGHVRIYRWNGISWIQKGNDIDGEAAGDKSGFAVSMPDSNIVAIGSPFNDGNGSSAGLVRIYRWNGSNWIQKGNNIDGKATGDKSGYSVSMPDTNTVAIGSPEKDLIFGASAGQVRVYSTECFPIHYPTTVSACNSYTSPSGNYTWTSSGNYSDTLTTTTGCDSVILINLTINTIDTSLSVSGNNITANQNGATYQWLSCDSNFAFTSTVDTNQTYSPIVNGNYAVQISLNGCTDTSTCVNISTIGINSYIYQQLFTLYPNPAQGEVHIIAMQKNTIKITDCSGRIIQTKTIIPGKNYTVKLPETGIYFISGTTNDKQMFVKKVINY